MTVITFIKKARCNKEIYFFKGKDIEGKESPEWYIEQWYMVQCFQKTKFYRFSVVCTHASYYRLIYQSMIVDII